MDAMNGCSYPTNAITIRTKITMRTTRCSLVERSKIRNRRFIYCGVTFIWFGFPSQHLSALSVMLSEAKHLWPSLALRRIW